MIIGVTGLNCAGKDTIAGFLQDKGFVHLSLSDAIRDELRAEDRELTRENLLEKGNALRETFGADILARRTLDKMKPGQNYVVTSIRNLAEYNALNERDDFTLVLVDAPLQLRFERVMERAGESDTAVKTLDDFEEAERREMTNDSTRQQLHLVIKEADYRVCNDGDFEHLQKQLNGILERVQQ